MISMPIRNNSLLYPPEVRLVAGENLEGNPRYQSVLPTLIKTKIGDPYCKTNTNITD